MKNPEEMDDPAFEAYLSGLFAEPVDYADAARFDDLVLDKLRLRPGLRRSVLILAGLSGAFYAVTGFVRLPQAKHDAAQALQAGETLIMAAGRQTDRLAALLAGGVTDGGLRVPLHDLSLFPGPIFFWLSFTLCLAGLGLYYACSQDERT